MQINVPTRKAVCFNLDKSIKHTLSKLAQHENTTLTNLLEEGARCVISNKLKQIRTRQVESQHLESSLNW